MVVFDVASLCSRNAPYIQGLYERLDSEGVKVVALTRLTKSATEDKVRQYIEESELSLPIGKEDGTLAECQCVGYSGIRRRSKWRRVARSSSLTDDLVGQLMQD